LNLQSHYDLKMARQNLDPKEAKRIKGGETPQPEDKIG